MARHGRVFRASILMLLEPHLQVLSSLANVYFVTSAPQLITHFGLESPWYLILELCE